MKTAWDGRVYVERQGALAVCKVRSKDSWFFSACAQKVGLLAKRPLKVRERLVLDFSRVREIVDPAWTWKP